MSQTLDTEGAPQGDAWNGWWGILKHQGELWKEGRSKEEKDEVQKRRLLPPPPNPLPTPPRVPPFMLGRVE